MQMKNRPVERLGEEQLQKKSSCRKCYILTFDASEGPEPGHLF